MVASGLKNAISQPRCRRYYNRVNKVMDKAFAKLKRQGIKDIYHLSFDDIDQITGRKVCQMELTRAISE